MLIISQLTSIKIKYFCLLLFFGSSQLFSQVPEFEDRIDLGEMSYQPNILKDISGMAASIKNKNVLWIHNDNDDGTAYAINLEGKQLAAYKLTSVQCEDIEDIAIGPAPEDGTYYIYLGDFGDNFNQRLTKYIYRFIEPDVDEAQNYTEADISDVEVLKFNYPGEERNAETVIVDPLSSEIYIASKERDITNIYRLNIPESFDDVSELEFIAEVEITEASGGNISAFGKEIIITNGKNVYYWKRLEDENLSETFKRHPATIKYIQEPQCEAVSWSSDDTGYFSTSEDRGIQPHLYYYPRIASSVNSSELHMKANFELKANYPNPFNSSTTISFILQNDNHIQIDIYDLQGRLIAELFNGFLEKGTHHIEWHLNDCFATGVYLLTVSTGVARESQKILYLK